MGSIIELPAIVRSLKKEDAELFSRIFEVHESTGELKFPESMHEWADKTFGSYKAAEKQKVIKTFNKWTFKGSLFNELRAKRPMSTKAGEDVFKIIKDAEGDNFCKPLTNTPTDTFGRVKGWRSVSCANAAKYDALHGLIIFKHHNPLDFKEADIQDYFSTAMKWFDAAHHSNPDAKYPYLLWNCLWRSGASMIHGHMQTVLGQGSHYAWIEFLKKVHADYKQKYGTNYFEDLYKAHEMIGLGFEKHGVKVLCSITPKKDKEVTMVSKKLDKKTIKVIYKVANSLVNDFGVESFNLAVMMPPMTEKALFKKSSEAGWEDFPFIVKIVDRGKLANKTTDIAGMEMYSGTTVIETDPYRICDDMKKKIS